MKAASFTLGARRALLALLALGISLAAAPTAIATNFPVTITSDPVPGVCDSSCSLREAIRAANVAVGTDTITLPAGHYVLTQTGSGEEVAATGDLDITDSVAITGAGAGATTVDAGGAAGIGDRVFDMPGPLTAKSVTIAALTVTGGRTAVGSDNSGAGVRDGMALSSLMLSRVVVSGNATADGGEGGGVVEDDGTVTIADSTIRGNTATFGGGATENGAATLNVTRSTITGNTATGTGTAGTGGGLSEDGGGTLNVVNSTITGNTARSGGGVGETGAGPVNITFSTVAGNRATGPPVTGTTPTGGNLYETGGAQVTVTASIVSAGSPANCFTVAPNPVIASGGHNIDSGTGCAFTKTGDLAGRDPLLGALAANGGPTGTMALGQGSPAIDAGGAVNCPTTDQRGVARPQRGGCDIGAFEAAPAQAGLPAPVLGKTVNVVPVKGKVFVSVAARKTARVAAKVPGIKGRTFVPLTAGRQIPVGSLLDTRRGTVRLTSAKNSSGQTQSGDFASGVFQVLQSGKAKAKGLTELRLKGASFSRCKSRKRGKRAGTSRASKRKIRRLRANAKGRFRTRGRYSSATVRGTVWITTDRCDGTLTQVKRGKVAVRDFRRKKTIVVKAGKRYLAKARR